LEQNFPELAGRITGSNQPPPPLVELLSKLVGLLQVCGMVVGMVGARIFTMVGMRHTPSWYPTIEKNIIPIAIGLYLVVPQMLGKYSLTGAFEIVMDDDVVIFSKLATGRLPQLADLVHPLVEAGLKYAGGS
jgi:selT/selW/selH-like putative selenoprotein